MTCPGARQDYRESRVLLCGGVKKEGKKAFAVALLGCGVAAALVPYK
ncbi:MAG: hypothetical protein ACLR8P_16685 [Clostridium fessum]